MDTMIFAKKLNIEILKSLAVVFLLCDSHGTCQRLCTAVKLVTQKINEKIT